MNILIIGAGNMGITYAQSFVNANIIRPSQLYFIDRTQRREEQMHKLSIHPLYEAPGSFVRKMDLIILSVKPQDFNDVADSLAPQLNENQLILSIMAGININSIKSKLKTKKVIRAMPNLPSQVGQGMTVFTTTSGVSRAELLAVHNLLNTTGKTLYTDNEMMIDAATAISGSGPGYVFFIMNSMMEVARQMGFSESEAQLLVRQTFLGSVDLLNQNDLHCEEWVKKVASKGGTTEAALQAFEKTNFVGALEAGLSAAYERARALSEE
jgi:pyrroline-5-carboxylate reductase